MKKVILVVLLGLFLPKAFSQDCYWNNRGLKSYQATFKSAFVTTIDQENQFIVKHNKDGKIDFLFLTEKRMYGQVSAYFRFDNTKIKYYVIPKKLNEGVYILVGPYSDNSDELFKKSSDLSYITIETFISYLKSNNYFYLHISTYNEYSLKEYEFKYTLKGSAKLLNWALTNDFD